MDVSFAECALVARLFSPDVASSFGGERSLAEGVSGWEGGVSPTVSPSQPVSLAGTMD